MKRSDLIQRQNDALKALGAITSDPYRSFRLIESRASQANEDYANGLIDSEEHDLKVHNVRQNIRRIFGGTIPDAFYFNSDPRGYALKLKDDYIREAPGPISKIHRDFGGYGILAPEF